MGVKNVKKSIVRAMGLAPEAVGCVRLVVTDDTDVVIENRGRVKEYTQKRISVDAGELAITIEGSGMVLESLEESFLAVRGRIFSVRYESKRLKP